MVYFSFMAPAFRRRFLGETIKNVYALHNTLYAMDCDDV